MAGTVGSHCGTGPRLLAVLAIAPPLEGPAGGGGGLAAASTARASSRPAFQPHGAARPGDPQPAPATAAAPPAASAAASLPPRERAPAKDSPVASRRLLRCRCSGSGSRRIRCRRGVGSKRGRPGGKGKSALASADLSKHFCTNAKRFRASGQQQESFHEQG